jgi:hypothetical protein
VNKVIKQAIVFILVFLLSIIAVSAIPDFYLNATPVKNNIYPNESAEFIFTITNNRVFNMSFTLKSPQLTFWDIMAKPLYDYPNVHAGANSSKQINLFFNPLSSAIGTGTKIVTIEATSDKGIKQSQSVTIYIIPEGTKFGQYYPRVVIEQMEIPRRIDPKEELVLFFKMVNKNSLDIPKVAFRLSSRLIKETIVEFPMPPYNETLLRVVPELDEYAYAGTDTVKMDIIVDGDIINGYEREVEIKAVDIPYEAQENMSKSFLKTVYTYDVLNPSNINKTEAYYLPTSYLDRIFSFTRPKAKISKAEGHNYAWDLKLAPGERTTVIVIRSYRSLLYLAIALVVFLIIYYIFRPDLVINKNAAKIVSKEGGFSESTIQMILKNISNYRLEDINVEEIIPNIAEYVAEQIIGVVTPLSVKKFELRGTVLRWHFDELAPKEERILTFKMRTKLDVVGKFKLSTTKAEYVKKGKKRMAFSNTVYLSR